MRKIPVVAAKHNWPRLPITWTFCILLAQDVWRPPGWICGAVWTFTAILWIGSLYNVAAAEPHEPNWKP